MITTHLENDVFLDLEEHGVTLNNEDPMLDRSENVFVSKEQAIKAAELILKFYQK